MDGEPEIPRRRTGWFVLAGVVGFAALAVAVYQWTRPPPCAQVADRVCALGSIGERDCAPIRQALASGKVADAQCREALSSIGAVERMHWTEQSAGLAAVLGKLLGMEAAMGPIHDGARRLEALRGSLGDGAAGERERDELVAVGPRACPVVLARWKNSDDPRERRALHEVMQRWRAGDLGEAADAWQGWCAEVVHRAPAPAR